MLHWPFASKSKRRAAPRSRNALGRCRRLTFEGLERRELLAVTLNTIQDYTIPSGKDLFVPLTGLDSGGQTVNYTVTSGNANVTASVLTTGQSLKLNVSGGTGVSAFSGDLTLRLFEDLAPNATSRIKSLVGQSFYNGLTFHRVLDNFVAQGGDPKGDGTGGTGNKFDDEFNSRVTFVSPGLLAMANSGDDTNDSQFFIVDTDLSLAQMPQHLNFNHTIFGVLTSGFDTFTKIMTTPVNNSVSGTPLNKVTINTATIFNDTQNGVLRISDATTFVGNSFITVTATGGGGATDQRTFDVTVQADTVNDRPFLGPVANQTTTEGAPVSFTLTSTDLENDVVTYTVTDPNNFGVTPANVSVSVDQATGKVTLTPAAGFLGTINLVAGVRDGTNRVQGGTLSSRDNFDTQRFTLTVNASGNAPQVPTGVGLSSASNSGPFDGSNYTSSNAPTLSATAQPGKTVEFLLGGTVIATATETASGQYSATIPAGKLALGQNDITARARDSGGTSALSGTLSMVYAPSFNQVYTVPGTPGVPATINFRYAASQAKFHNEVGFYLVDAANGTVGGVVPGAAGYAQAALNSPGRQVLFQSSQTAGVTQNFTLNGGQLLAFYMIQNDTSADFLARNASNRAPSSGNPGPVAFFSVDSANPDNLRHLQTLTDAVTGTVQYRWEDLFGLGDRDFNDVVMSIFMNGNDSESAMQAFRVPAAPGRTVSATFTLTRGTKTGGAQGASTPTGEIGIYTVLDPDGGFGANHAHPGDTNYASSVFGSTLFQVLFAPGDAIGTKKTVTLNGNDLIGFYSLNSGTSQQFLAANPTNSASGSSLAFFSYDTANPDQKSHIRSFSGETVGEDTPTAGATSDRFRVHLMNKLNGGDADFDDFVVSLDLS